MLNVKPMTSKTNIGLLVFVCLILASGLAMAQGQELMRGIVVDSATLNALPSVNVQVKHSGRGTTTDEKGNFSIRASRRDTLIFSSVGYRTLQLPLALYEAGIIRLSEQYTLLKAVTIDEMRRSENPYEGMFADRNAMLDMQKRIPFYFSKSKKDKIKTELFKAENERVKTYLDVVVNNPDLKTSLMKKYSLTEDQYYEILRAFNESHYQMMYYLTSAELISFLNRFFESRASSR